MVLLTKRRWWGPRRVVPLHVASRYRWHRSRSNIGSYIILLILSPPFVVASAMLMSYEFNFNKMAVVDFFKMLFTTFRSLSVLLKVVNHIPYQPVGTYRIYVKPVSCCTNTVPATSPYRRVPEIPANLERNGSTSYTVRYVLHRLTAFTNASRSDLRSQPVGMYARSQREREKEK